jgi:hypothetical protein
MIIQIKEKEFESFDLSKFFIPSNVYVCENKVRFDSVQEAYRIRDRKYPDLTVYFCSVCNGWHLGHRIGWKKMKRELVFALEDLPMFSNCSFQKTFKLEKIRRKRSRDFLRKNKDEK